MINKIIIRRFKSFEDVTIELGDRVVLIGPNNSGKTSALQAISLWYYGLVEWITKKGNKNLKYKTGIALNRKDIVPIPLIETIFLWKDTKVRKSYIIKEKQHNENIRIEIIVYGITNGVTWEYGLEFDYANKESVYCRPMKNYTEFNIDLNEIKIAYLQPMSGLATIEPKWEPGRINVLLGEGQTAQVLRNLCYQIFISENLFYWNELNENLKSLFGDTLEKPEYNAARGEVYLNYKNKNGIVLDLSCSGRGFQQTLLLLAYLYNNPGTVLLFDEPDAHLEILRQRQIYKMLSEVAVRKNSQIIIASHSEIILNEAVSKDLVIAFLGKPHRIDDKGSQLLKSLCEIGYEQYYLAEQIGWALYLEGSTDLYILQKISEKLDHPVKSFLERPFVNYVSNQPNKAEKHFHGLKEAKDDLVGIALFDNLDQKFNTSEQLIETCWKKKEIENYFIDQDVLINYSRSGLENDLFGIQLADKREKIMRDCILDITNALKTLKKPDPWSDEIKITDDFLDRLFEIYFEKIGLPNLMRKTNYHTLIDFFNLAKLDKEFVDKLNLIYEVAIKAKPVIE